MEPVAATRLRLRVRGLVQGVGFRPFVYRLASAYQLAGWVCNAQDAVLIEVQGLPDQLAAFRTGLDTQLPPLARVDQIETQACSLVASQTDFRILESQVASLGPTPIPADVAPCPECLRELNDPHDRRYRYPFINCMNCGPRFTIIQGLPYDRSRTTMGSFAMCARCASEYADPLDRRYHAQPIACPTCGPQIWFVAASQVSASGAAAATGASYPHGAGQTPEQALAQAHQCLFGGGIVAVKGIGGFHLVCDATDGPAVRRLRQRKGRLEKPLAVMLASLEAVRSVAELTAMEAELVSSPARPIVLLRKRLDSHAVVPEVAPESPYLGVMLPYSPLHYLLMQPGRPLVMTSGNLSEEPIAWQNQEALARLQPLADGFLLHDRPIHAVCDDSVVRLTARGHFIPIRRSRGYAPMPIRLQPPYRDGALAVGGELKNAFCLCQREYAYLSQHIGDTENSLTLSALERYVQSQAELLNVRPSCVIADMHPAYLSSQWAEQLAGRNQLPLQLVQHHHAHVAALAAEHGWPGTEPLLAICLDGTGYGTDGTIWGGELLLMRGRVCQRLGWLEPMPLPGGDASIRQPYRAALAYLHACGLSWSETLACTQAASAAELKLLARQLERNLQCPRTSSLGRLFDVVAALIGIRQHVTYEAQAAMQLEHLAAEYLQQPSRPAARYRLAWLPGTTIAQLRPLLESLVQDIQSGCPPAEIAAGFMLWVVELITAWARHWAAQSTNGTVGLTGGVFQNALLLDLATEALEQAGYRPLTHRQVPPNDAGLSLGQAWLASQLP